MLVQNLRRCGGVQGRLIGPSRRIMVVMMLVACARGSLRHILAPLAIAVLGTRLLLNTIACLCGSLMLNMCRSLEVVHAIEIVRIERA